MSDDSILKDGDWVVMDMQEKGVIATLEEINLPKRIPLKMTQSVFCGDKDVELVMSQTLATEEKAREALTIKSGDVVEAIMYLTERQVEDSYIRRKDETDYVQKMTGCARIKAKQALRKTKGDVTLAISSLKTNK